MRLHNASGRTLGVRNDKPPTCVRKRCLRRAIPKVPEVQHAEHKFQFWSLSVRSHGEQIHPRDHQLSGSSICFRSPEARRRGRLQYRLSDESGYYFLTYVIFQQTRADLVHHQNPDSIRGRRMWPQHWLYQTRVQSMQQTQELPWKEAGSLIKKGWLIDRLFTKKGITYVSLVNPNADTTARKTGRGDNRERKTR